MLLISSADSRLEGWLALPTKSSKRFGWDKKVLSPILFLRFGCRSHHDHHRERPLTSSRCFFPSPCCVVRGGEQQEDPVLQQRAGPRTSHPLYDAGPGVSYCNSPISTVPPLSSSASANGFYLEFTEFIVLVIEFTQFL